MLCCNVARAKMYISILLRFSILLYVWFDRHGHILQIKECLLCFFVDFLLHQIVTKYYFQNLCLRFFSIFMLFFFFNINVLLPCQSFAYINIHSTLCKYYCLYDHCKIFGYASAIKKKSHFDVDIRGE